MTSEQIAQNVRIIWAKYIGLQNNISDEEINQFASTIEAIESLDYYRLIPVSERLPKNDEGVLVCYPNGGMEVVYYHIDNSIYPTEYKDSNETGWCNEEGDAIYFEPVAWMPLPEPYKAESEEV